MKTRFFLLIALVIFAAACEKDPFSNGPSFTDGKPGKTNGELHLPFKASFSTIPDAPVLVEVAPGVVIEVSSGGLISGNATQVGRIQAANSRYAVIGLLAVDSLLLKQIIDGQIAAPNGDYYTYTGEAVISSIDGSLNGTMDFTGGVGKFEGVSGSIVITGTANPVTSEASFRGEGVIIFPN